MFSGLAEIINPVVAAAQKYTSVFVPTGWIFVALAITLTAVVIIYDWWMGDPQASIARLVRLGLVAFVVVSVLKSWDYYMQTFISAFANDLAAPLSGSSGSAQLSTIIGKIQQSMFPDARKGDSTGILEFVKDGKSIGQYLMMNITRAVFELILFVVSLIMILCLLLAFYGPALVMQVGAIFGPLLLPWLLFDPLDYLAKSWFKFMVTTGITLLVALCLGLIAATAIESFTDQMAKFGSDPSVTWAEEMSTRISGLVTILSGMVFMSLMILKADAIAGAMTGGDAGGGGVAGAVAKGIKGMLPKKGGKK